MGEDNKKSTEEAAFYPAARVVSGMYERWFLDYASYVILERAVPANEDGLKPVQRRILHTMETLDDGRFNKVANLIGSTMQYHPHGDASIGDALVNLGQKDLLIETQGNWGDVKTGDRAAAARYIEARLSDFAKEVAFNAQTTHWQLSYDGRKKEPIHLPMKFPLLLQQGVEGIAVGLATKIMPHNFCELLEASIAYLNKKPINLLPDFPTGGLVDVSQYNQGRKGGKIKVRAKIEVKSNKLLVISEIPYSTTTQSLIDSVVKANERGKIKIKKVVDNTAKDIEIELHIAAGQSPDLLIGALYAFTDCEVSISPNACVIVGDRPHFLGVHDMLAQSTDRTVKLLQTELEIKQQALKEKRLFSALEKIFIEQRIYRNIEVCETWESVLETIDKGLEPYKSLFYREITEDDLVRLTEIKIKRISKYDSFKADELMVRLDAELEETAKNLANIVKYAIFYFKNLLKKYGKGRARRTEIRTFDTITAAKVAANNTKLYVNRKDGFIGYGLKKDEFVCDCSDIDDVIVFKKDGKYLVTKISDKVFVGKDILYLAIFLKNDERMVYNTVYIDGETGVSRIKRFRVLAINRDKAYDLTRGTDRSKLLYFTANPNGEAERIQVTLSPACRARLKKFEYDFAKLDIKGRGAQGNILTKYPVKKIALKAEGSSTLSALSLWYDPAVGRINKAKRGKYLGEFDSDGQILAVYQSGIYEITDTKLTNRYAADKLMLIEKFDPQKILSAIYFEGKQKNYYLKRFKIETSTQNKPFSFISEHPKSALIFISTQAAPEVWILPGGKAAEEAKKTLSLEETTEVKGWKAIGTKLPYTKITEVKEIAAEAPTQTDSAKKQLKLF